MFKRFKVTGLLMALVLVLVGCDAHGDLESIEHKGQDYLEFECRVQENDTVIRQEMAGAIYGTGYGAVRSTTDGTNLVRCELMKGLIVAGYDELDAGTVVVVKSPDKKAVSLQVGDVAKFGCSVDDSEGVSGMDVGIWELDGCRLKSPVVSRPE